MQIHNLSKHTRKQLWLSFAAVKEKAALRKSIAVLAKFQANLILILHDVALSQPFLQHVYACPSIKLNPLLGTFYKGIKANIHKCIFMNSATILVPLNEYIFIYKSIHLLN